MTTATLICLAGEFPLGKHDFVCDELPFLQGKDWRLVFIPTVPPLEVPSEPVVSGAVITDMVHRDRWQRLGDRLHPVAWKLLFREYVGSDRSRGTILFRNLSGATARAAHAYTVLRQVLGTYVSHGEPVVIYSYWFSEMLTGLALLRRDFPHLRIVTRAHGGDLYPERKPGNYLPFQWQRHHAVDMVFPCSQNGAAFLRSSGFPCEKIAVSYLGVPRSAGQAPMSPETHLTLVSNCWIKPVKRMPLLVESLHALASARPDIAIDWHHLGGGVGLSELEAHAVRSLSPLANLQFTLHGSMSVGKCRAFFTERPVDGFVSVSESEGVPVSMMEAIAAGVPILGTDVGGVSEVVTSATGTLLTKDFSPEEFVRGAESLFRWKSAEARREIQRFHNLKFEQTSNYTRFVDECLWPQVEVSRRLAMAGRT